MRVLDPGHEYELAILDAKPGDKVQTLTFVKREGQHYPGNSGSHSGTTMQETLRVLIDRAHYVNNQIPHPCTQHGIDHMRMAIQDFELRAAMVHERILVNVRKDIENELTCPKCGHIQCTNPVWRHYEPKTS